MNTYLFYYRNMNIGGCQLLIAKLTNAFIKNGDKAIIFCEYIDPSISDVCKDAIIHGFGSKNWNSDSTIRKNLLLYPDARIITFLWEDFARLYTLTRKNPTQSLLFYAVHSHAIKNAGYSRNLLLRIIRKTFLTPVIKKLIINGNIVAMDEATIQHTEAYYKFKIQNMPIIRIPIDYSSNDYDEEIIRNKISNNNKNILAIARAEFPFKGYLLGLIDAVKNKVIPNDYSLTIVSYGEDEDILKRAIDSLNTEQKNRVRLIGKTPYEELKNLFNSSIVYIGMGTTLLDASKHGVISIPVAPYTNNVYCNNFFHEKPESLGASEYSEYSEYSEEKLGFLIHKIEAMNMDEKLTLSKEIVKTVRTLYNSETTALAIEKTFNGMNSKLNNKRIIVSYFIRKIKRFIQNLIRM